MLFLEPRENENELYAMIREEKSKKKTKDQIEMFWKAYEDKAPINFKKNIQRDFYQR